MSEGLQTSIGSNVDRLVAEAERILGQLEERNFEDSKNATGDEYDAAEERKSVISLTIISFGSTYVLLQC